MRELILGIDLGTSGCRCAAVDVASGEVAGLAAASYPGMEPGDWSEQDPAAVLEGLLRTVAEAVAAAEGGGSPARWRAMSIGGTLHSLVALGEDGEPLTPISTWADSRAVRQARALRGTPEGEALYRATGCPPHAMYPLYKIRLLREEQPELHRRARRFLSAKAFVVSRLTGRFLEDTPIASGSGLLDLRAQRWCPLPLEHAGIGPERLGELAAPGAVVQGLVPALAARMGLPPDLPLVLGASDAVHANLGSGGVRPWQATCTVGTSGALRLISDRPLLDGRGRTWCYSADAGRWLAGGAIHNGGIALNWVRDLLSAGGAARPLSFEQVLELAAGAPAGARGLLCLPLFAGERSPNWNERASGVLFGLRLEHGPAEVARAVLEGICYRMRSLLEALEPLAGGIREVRASGGFTRSPLWLQIMADVLGRRLAVPAAEETASLGAGFWALQHVGAVATFEAFADRVAPVRPPEEGRVFEPDPAAAGLHGEAYARYGELYGRVSPLYR